MDGRSIKALCLLVHAPKEFQQLNHELSRFRSEGGEAFDHVRGGNRLMGEIKAHHRDLPGGVKDDRRCLGVNQNVEFSRGGGVALRITPAHEDYFGHALDNGWFALDGDRDIAYRSGRYERYFAGLLTPSSNDDKDDD